LCRLLGCCWIGRDLGRWLLLWGGGVECHDSGWGSGWLLGISCCDWLVGRRRALLHDRHLRLLLLLVLRRRSGL
jgi:hypothetical protein